MKRVFSLLIALLLTLTCFAVTVYAETERVLPRCNDEAGLLTDSENEQLNALLDEKSNAMQYGINILTVEELGEKSSYDYANDYYNDYKLGIGEKQDGFILLISMKPSRNAQLVATGTPSKEYVMDDVLNYIMQELRDAEYYTAFTKFVGYIENKGEIPEDVNQSPAAEFTPYNEAVIPSERQKPRLVDAAQLIDDEKEKELLSLLDSKSEENSFDIVIVTTPSTNGKEPMDYADDYYDYNGFGYGEERDGALLLISMEPRYVYISTCGKGIKILTDDKWDIIIDNFYTELKAGEYDKVCDIYISDVQNYIDLYNVTPYGLIIVALIIGFIIASIIVSSMKKKNYSVYNRAEATEYIVPGSLAFIGKNDTFLYRNVTKTAIPKDTDSGSSGSSGGGTHVSSSGTTHGGGGRSF